MFARYSLSIIATLTLTAALAKGVTARIVIAGTALNDSVVITEPGVLERFSIWSGPKSRWRVAGGEWQTDYSRTFIDFEAGTIDAPPEDIIWMDVTFYQADRPGGETWDDVYQVVYAFTPGSAGGYFYLPITNQNLIIHGVEGNWLHSTTDWEEVVRPLLDEAIKERS